MLVPSMENSVLQRSVVVTQHSYRINESDHATKLTPELHTIRQEPMYVVASLESKPMVLKVNLFYGAHQRYKNLAQCGQGERVGYNVYEAAGCGIGLKYQLKDFEWVKLDSNKKVSLASHCHSRGGTTW